MSTQNALEILMQKAATDPTCRLEFYKNLLLADIFFLGTKKDTANGEGTPLDISYWQKQDGSLIIPFFSSLDQLQKAIGEPHDYIGLNARVFFQCTVGARYVLNPYSEYGKEFEPEEISALLDGSLLKNFEVVTIPQGSTIYIGQPATYPTELVQHLQSLFKNKPDVRSAYLAQISAREEAGNDIRLVVTLDAEGDFVKLVSEISAVLKTRLAPNEYVDFTRIGDSRTIDEYIKQIEPFYIKHG